MLLASWIAVPAVVSHLAASEPLWFETVTLTDFQPQQRKAFRSLLPSGLDSRWSTRFTHVLEDGTPLRPGSLAAVQSRRGRFLVRSNVVFLSASDRSDPRSNGRIYQARLPLQISATAAGLLAAVFLALHLAAAATFLPTLLRYRPSWRPLLSIALGLAGFAIISVVADRLPLTQGTDLVGERLDAFREDKHSFDALFLGSSRVYRQLDPRVFDAVYAERGREMRSFNLGTPGTRIFEALATIRWVLALRPQRLRLLVIDFNGDPLRTPRENFDTARVIRYHTLRNTIVILRGLVASGKERSVKLLETGLHLQTAAVRATNIGRGLSWVASAASDRQPHIPQQNRGFFSLDEELRRSSPALRAVLRKRYKDLHSNLGHYRSLRRRLPGRQKRPPKINELEISLFRTLQEEAREHGVRVVFLIDSRINTRHDLVHAFEIGAVDTLLRFDDPDRFPELYDPENRFDIHHLNEETTKLYTRFVAERILELEEAR